MKFKSYILIVQKRNSFLIKFILLTKFFASFRKPELKFTILFFYFQLFYYVTLNTLSIIQSNIIIVSILSIFKFLIISNYSKTI